MSEIDNDFFEYGASFIVTKNDYNLYYRDSSEVLGLNGERFIAPSNQMDELLILANGDTDIIEQGLGIDPPGKWADKELVRIDIDKSIINDFYENGKLKLPTGMESGTNDKWIPGGKTSGGIEEILKVSYGNALSDALGKIAYDYVFRSKEILKMEITAGNIINFLLDKFIPAAIHYDTEIKLSPMEDRLISIISENYCQIYTIYSEGKSDKEKLYLRLLLVTDFVCGMTDSYAKRIYQELSGIV